MSTPPENPAKEEFDKASTEYRKIGQEYLKAKAVYAKAKVKVKRENSKRQDWYDEKREKTQAIIKKAQERAWKRYQKQEHEPSIANAKAILEASHEKLKEICIAAEKKAGIKFNDELNKTMAVFDKENKIFQDISGRYNKALERLQKANTEYDRQDVENTSVGTLENQIRITFFEEHEKFLKVTVEFKNKVEEFQTIFEKHKGIIKDAEDAYHDAQKKAQDEQSQAGDAILMKLRRANKKADTEYSKRRSKDYPNTFKKDRDNAKKLAKQIFQKSSDDIKAVFKAINARENLKLENVLEDACEKSEKAKIEIDQIQILLENQAVEVKKANAEYDKFVEGTDSIEVKKAYKEAYEQVKTNGFKISVFQKLLPNLKLVK